MYVVTNGLGWALDELEVSVVSEYVDVGGLDICEYFDEREGFNVYLAVEIYHDGDYEDIAHHAEIVYFPRGETPRELNEGEFEPWGYINLVCDRRKIFRLVG